MTKSELLKKRVGFISLGCDKNRVDLEKIIFSIKNAGFKIVTNPIDAHIIIINTCSFIESSRQESIGTILEMANYKSLNLEKLIITGCINEMGYSDLESSLPEVDAFIRLADNDNIVEKIYQLYEVNLDNDNHKITGLNRILTTPKHYAYLKIGDGCNNFCSYCKIPYIRGRFKSEKIEDLVKEANQLVDSGVTELILVAQDVTKYGIDLYGKIMLCELINELSKIDKLKWIRLLYCYPENITDELIETIANNKKVCKYLDIPMQHVNSRVLKQMNRKSNFESLEILINKLKSKIKDISIRTTFILGFPGETDEEFKQLCDFVERHKLNNVGFFTYSKEEGTLAYKMENQIPKNIKNKRLKTISELQFKVVNKLNQSFVGKEVEVVVDEIDGEYTVCRSMYQTPLVDSLIFIKNNKLIVGNFYKIKITNHLNYDFEGELL